MAGAGGRAKGTALGAEALDRREGRDERGEREDAVLSPTSKRGKREVRKLRQRQLAILDARERREAERKEARVEAGREREREAKAARKQELQGARAVRAEAVIARKRRHEAVYRRLALVVGLVVPIAGALIAEFRLDPDVVPAAVRARDTLVLFGLGVVLLLPFARAMAGHLVLVRAPKGLYDLQERKAQVARRGRAITRAIQVGLIWTLAVAALVLTGTIDQLLAS